MPQGPTGHLLHKATFSRLIDVANKEKQTQRDKQNEEKEEYVTNKQTKNKTTEKELNEREIRNLSNKKLKVMAI